MVENQEMTYDDGTSGGGAPFACIEDAVPEGGSQCLPGRMFSTPQPLTEQPLWPDQPDRIFPRPHAPAEPELPLPDLMQLGSLNMTDWLFLLLAVVVLVVGYALLRNYRVSLYADSQDKPTSPLSWITDRHHRRS